MMHRRIGVYFVLKYAHIADMTPHTVMVNVDNHGKYHKLHVVKIVLWDKVLAERKILLVAIHPHNYRKWMHAFGIKPKDSLRHNL